MKIGERVVLINIARTYRPTMSADELYERTRKWWRMSAGRDPDYAFAVYGGRVKAVYRIDGWERNPESGRRAFRGELDEAMTNRYIGGDVSEFFPPGAANPLRFLN